VLIHPWDSGTDGEALAFVRAHEFGQLVAAGRDRDIPVIVPTQFVLADEKTLLLHLARPNPIWAAIEEKRDGPGDTAALGHLRRRTPFEAEPVGTSDH
jgi:hypothetical protein